MVVACLGRVLAASALAATVFIALLATAARAQANQDTLRPPVGRSSALDGAVGSATASRERRSELGSFVTVLDSAALAA
jgi:hypothetical protein